MADAGGYVSPAQLRQGHPRVTDLIGSTPLVDLTRVAELRPGVRLLAKLESKNPGGSVKDRPAWGIVREALADGRLGKGQTLLDATSGNTGIAYAMLGAALGFAVRLCLPAQASEERRAVLAAYGAEVLLTDPMEGTNGAIREARRLASEGGAAVFYADQYSNPANWRAHYDTTAVEILQQTTGEVTHFVAGLGTTGTLMGVGRRFQRERPGVKLIAVQPDAAFHGIEGLKHLPTAIVPAIYDPTVPDEQLAVSTEDALRFTRLVARREGILAGISSGAALAAALRVAETVEGEATIVVLFPDGGERYTSQGLWERPA
ncbi:MAG TPA: cysteine synthase family protein [Candidatus Eisenbacteria bacterium]|nr:cysteine synthase family protein [Candidatus Eisenbacteria bacterium]